jgi:hypothetical protein
MPFSAFITVQSTSFVPLLQPVAYVGLIPELLKGIWGLRLCHGSNEKGTDHLPSSDERLTSFS